MNCPQPRDVFRIIALLSILTAGARLSHAQPPKGAAAPPTVLVEAVRKETLSEPKTFVGTIKPLRKSVVGSAASGRVEEYLINEGEFVKKGQPIAHLRRGIIGAEKKGAEAELEVRKAELAELEQSEQDEIAQGRAKLSNAEASLLFRKAKRDRGKLLGSALSRETLEEDTALAQQAQAAVDEAQAALRMLGGPRQQKTEQARSRVAVHEAEVERLTEQFDRHTLFAPFNGYVTAEHTEVGQWVMQGNPVAEIVELEMVDVEIGLLEDFVSRIDTSINGEVDVPAIRGRRFEGVSMIINPQADPRARTFPVKVRVKNEIHDDKPLLKAGMFARVTLPVGEPLPLELVPKDAVVLGGRSPLVYVVDRMGEKMTVRPVPVTLGVSRGLWISVGKNEVQEGQLVVVEGNERLRPLQEVRTERKEIPYAD